MNPEIRRDDFQGRYSIEFTLPGLPKMANASGAKSTHWRYAQAEARKWKQAVAALVAPHRPKTPLARYELMLIRCSSVEPDFDGLVRGFKHVVDGLKAVGVIADDRMRNSGAWLCSWALAAPKLGRIIVRVTEVRK